MDLVQRYWPRWLWWQRREEEEEEEVVENDISGTEVAQEACPNVKQTGGAVVETIDDRAKVSILATAVPSHVEAPRSGPQPVIKTADQFVQRLVDLVNIEGTRMSFETQAAYERQTSSNLQQQIDWRLARCTRLATRDSSSLQEHVRQLRAEVDWHTAKRRMALDSVDRLGRLLSSTSREKRRIFDTVSRHAQHYVDESQPLGTIGKLQVDQLFCGKLLETAQCQQLLAAEELVFANIQREFLATKAHAQQEDWRRAKDVLQLEREVQSQRVSGLIVNTIRPVLIDQGFIRPQTPNSAASSGFDLSLITNRDLASYEQNGLDEEHVQVEPPVLLSKLKLARQRYGKASRQHDWVRDEHHNGLASFLATYPQATQQQYDEQYEQRNGFTYETAIAHRETVLAKKRDIYNRIKEQAEKAKTPNLPLSPRSLADRSDDGSNSSFGARVNEQLRRGAASKERKIRRWGRDVARGRISKHRESKALSPIRTPTRPIGWRVSNAGSDTRASEPLSKSIRRERQHKEGLRKTTAQERRRYLLLLWWGRIVRTMRQGGRIWRLLGEDTPPKDPWEA